MTIQKQIVIRHRAPGHVRFQMPEQLCEPGIAELLKQRLAGLDGVYRVFFFRTAGKLSIRYHETVCDLAALAKRCSQMIAELEASGAFEHKKNERQQGYPTKHRKGLNLDRLPLFKWMRTKYTEAKETVQAAKIVTRVGLKKPRAFIKDPEKTAIEFFNDVLVLYLIKIHWTRITQEWIPRPLTHRYEWMAVFYLFYLLLRSRRPR